MQQKSKKAEIAAFVVGLLLIGAGLADWLSQYWTFDFEIGSSKTAVVKYEFVKFAMAGCQSDNDCEIGLECFHGKCSYPCRAPLMCPVGMVCGTAKYCEYEPEVCGDGIDNDRNGRIDEGCACIVGLTVSCSTGLPGICSMGQMTCPFDGRVSGICEPSTRPDRETCDGVDNDCNGSVDEGCECLVGDGRVCGTDIGACTTGIQTCSGGRWGVCTGEVTGSPETCDGVDNDCNGEVDEDCWCNENPELCAEAIVASVKSVFGL